MARESNSSQPPNSAPDPEKSRHPEQDPEPAGRVLYVAGEDGKFYRITEGQMKTHPVPEDDPIREQLEGYLAFGVVHASSARPPAGKRGVSFSQKGEVVSQGRLPVDFVDLGRKAGPPAGDEEAQPDEPED